MARNSRDRMVASAATLIGARGVTATSFTEVLKDSRAPRGSIYYHFPKGKRQLVSDALHWTTEQILAYQRTCGADTAAGVLEHFVRLFRLSLTSSECRAGCPVAGVVMDTYSARGPFREIARASFRSWISLLTEQLVAVGIPRASARSLSITTLASVEGGLILCRAEGTVAPLDLIAQQLHTLAASLEPKKKRGADVRVRSDRGAPSLLRARRSTGQGRRHPPAETDGNAESKGQ
jgi:TetR/AcrR family transcriptional repressor of lmrAB and yxaGH operons